MLPRLGRLTFKMPVTRSASGRSASAASAASTHTKTAAKRKATPTSSQKSPKKPRTAASASASSVAQAPAHIPQEKTTEATVPNAALVPAVLSFSFEDAKNHLTNTDERFQDLFDKLTCRPFEHLEQVHPFR
jgi:DNA-3-methyladenine glycosylase II